MPIERWDINTEEEITDRKIQSIARRLQELKRRMRDYLEIK